jgi:ribonuclease Z
VIEVCLLGNGGMMPLPGRPLSACLLRTGGETLLFDCGEGTQVNWRHSGWPYRPTGTLLLSHLHADHVAGLPGVLFQIAHSGRTEPVTIYGPRHTFEIVTHLTSIVGRTPYELRVIELDGGESLELPGGWRLATLATRHRMPCLAYTIAQPRAPRFNPERARELGVPLADWKRLQRGETMGDVAPADVLGPPRRGLKVALVTDTAYFAELTAFVEDADLLVCEAIYAGDEDTAKAEQRGHMVAGQAAQLARDSGARRLWLTHLSPSVERPEDVLERAQRDFPAAALGAAGRTLALRFDVDE